MEQAWCDWCQSEADPDTTGEYRTPEDALLEEDFVTCSACGEQFEGLWWFLEWCKWGMHGQRRIRAREMRGCSAYAIETPEELRPAAAVGWFGHGLRVIALLRRVYGQAVSA